MPFDGTLKFDTAIDQTGFKVGIGNIGNIAKSGMNAVKNAFAIGTAAVTAATGAVSALGAAAVNVGSGFESSMAQVVATMGITKDTIQDGVNSYDLLKQAAADAGESTTFSASEAADALNYLALAGYDAVQAASALPSVLDLAAAGGLDLAYASDLATDAMAALGIEASGENLTKFGDQMAKTASKANTSVSQLGEAILTVGGTAKSLAGGTDELNAALGVLANRGIKGSEGGTALRNVILALSAPTDTAAEAMAKLGLEAYDADGNLRPLNEVFKDLDSALSGMSEGEKTQVLNEIFNKVDLKSAQALLAGCGDEFTDLTTELANCDGAMSQMAKTMNDTLEGDIKSLQSKAEALGITVYEGLNTPLRDLAQLGGTYISQLTESFKSGGFEGLAASLGDVLGSAVTELSGYIPKITEIGVSLLSALGDGLVKNMPSIAKNAVSVGVTLLSGIGSVLSDVSAVGASLFSSLSDSITQKLPRIKRVAKDLVKRLQTAITDDLPVMLEAGAEIVGALGGVILENLPLLLDAGLQIIQTLGRTLIDNLPLLIETAVSLITMFASYLAENAPTLIETAVGLLETIINTVINNLSLLIEAAVMLIATLGTYIAEHAPELAVNALKLIQTILDTVIENLPVLVEAAVQIITALCKGLQENTADILIAVETIIKTLCDLLFDPEFIQMLAAAGTEILAALLPAAAEMAGDLLVFVYDLFNTLYDVLFDVDWTELGKNILLGIADGLMNIDAGIFNDFKDAWVTGIKDIFGIHSPSKLMQEVVGKNLALGIGIGFTEEIPDVGKDAVRAFKKWEFPDFPDIPDFPEFPDVPDFPDMPDFPELPDRPDTRTPRFSPDVLQTLKMQNTAPVVMPSATSEIVNNYYNSQTTTNDVQTDTPQSSGDIIIPVSIGGQHIETVVVKALQIANAQSGGVTI